METINNIELNDANIYPDEEVLSHVLGESYPAYESLLELFKKNEMVHEWRYYNDGKAWLCKVQRKKKTIVWMSAWKDYMQAGIYIPLRCIEDIFSLDISEETKNKIKETKNVGKSKPCIFEIRDEHLFDDLQKVITYKIKLK